MSLFVTPLFVTPLRTLQTQASGINCFSCLHSQDSQEKIQPRDNSCSAIYVTVERNVKMFYRFGKLAILKANKAKLLDDD